MSFKKLIFACAAFAFFLQQAHAADSDKYPSEERLQQMAAELDEEAPAEQEEEAPTSEKSPPEGVSKPRP